MMFRFKLHLYTMFASIQIIVGSKCKFPSDEQIVHDYTFPYNKVVCNLTQKKRSLGWSFQFNPAEDNARV